MQCFTLILFVSACLLLNAGVSGHRMTTCGQNVHRLTCDTGVISVTDGFYGRKDSITCAGGRTTEEVSNTECTLATALDFITKRCQGKKWCELSPDCFESDPCRDTYKYIQSSYICIPAIHMIVCEQNMAHMDCQENEVIEVFAADWGRRDHTTCALRVPTPMVQKTDCYNPTNFPGEKCNLRPSCPVRVNKAVLGQGCAGTAQYLELAYFCKPSPGQQYAKKSLPT